MLKYYLSKSKGSQKKKIKGCEDIYVYVFLNIGFLFVYLHTNKKFL